MATWIKHRQDRRTATGRQKNEDSSSLLPLTPVPSALSSSSDSSNFSFQHSAFSFSARPGRYLLALGSWAVLCVGITEAWYWAHDIKAQDVIHWSVALPVDKSGFEKIELPHRSLKLLAFDEGATGKWSENDGSKWTLYFFRWNPTSAASVFRARQHRPDVCLPAAGLRLVKDHGLTPLSIGDLKLPFRSYVYESGGQPLYVFFCQWEDGAREQTGLASSEQAGRMVTALKGRRHLGQQSLEFILSDFPSFEEASQALSKQLPSLIRIGQKTAKS
jgi:hypothetical protein